MEEKSNLFGEILRNFQRNGLIDSNLLVGTKSPFGLTSPNIEGSIDEDDSEEADDFISDDEEYDDGFSGDDEDNLDGDDDLIEFDVK